MGPSTHAMKARLDGLCARDDTAGTLGRDPFSVALAYQAPLDREVAALVAAHLAYGRVDPMSRSVRATLAPMRYDVRPQSPGHPARLPWSAET